MFYPNVNIHEMVGEFSEIELALEELCTDEEQKNKLNTILHRHRLFELEQHNLLLQKAQLDFSATISAQAGLKDVLIPDCINTPQMRHGLVGALSCGGLMKYENGLKLKNWNERQLGYFVMQLHPFPKGTMPNNELSDFFHVQNLSRAISSYQKENMDNKPRGYESVDRVIEAIAC